MESREEAEPPASDEPVTAVADAQTPEHVELSSNSSVEVTAEAASEHSVETPADATSTKQTEEIDSPAHSAAVQDDAAEPSPEAATDVKMAVESPTEDAETSESAPTDGHQTATDLESQAEPPTIVAARVSIDPGDAGQIWSQVVAEINDMLKSHVKQVSKAAIAAPNKLELTFPRKYHFSKRYCEKPEVISRLEQIAEKITGQYLRVSLVMGEDEGSVTTAPEQTQPANKPARKRAYKPEEDDFVAAVMQTFEAECVRVDSRAVGGAPSDS